MLKNRRHVFRLIVLLFMLTVTVPILPCETVNIHGLFGEIRTSAVASDSGEAVSEMASKMTVRIRVKGENIFNVWLMLVAVIVCLAFEMCIFRLPKKDTIVAKRVRMDH